MRVLMTTDAVGGVWSHALTLAETLHSVGVHTTLAVLGPPPVPHQLAAAAAIPDLDLRQVDGPLDWRAPDVAALVPIARQVAELARTSAVDVVHLNSPSLASLARFPAPVLGACHSCLASWWACLRDGPLPADFRWRTDLLIGGYAACDLLVAPSVAFAATTAALYGVAPVVVHNGALWPQSFARAARTRCVLTAGRLWDEAKGLATLDAAAAALDAPLLAAGSVHHPDGGTAIACTRAVPLGPLSNATLRRHMRAAPIFASAARYEPFGLTVLEAAQEGCALVLADIPSFRELWQDACILIPPTNITAWTRALQTLLDDREETSRLATLATARAAQYSARSMADALFGLYCTLASRQGWAA